MDCSVFFSDNAPHRVTRSASAPSTTAIAPGDSINAVRHTMVRTTRSLIIPAANSAAILGSRSRNATPRWVCDNANP